MDFVALDLETANPDLSSICQIGIAAFRDGQVVSEFSTLIDPEDYFDPMNISIHGIMEDHVRGAPTYTQICDQINSILAGSICATHTHFDRSAIQQCCARHDLPLPECNWLDTARVARRTWDAVARKGYGLANLASMLGIEFKHHDALEDAKAAGLVLCAAVNESGIDPQAWLKRVNRRIGGSHSSTGAYAAPIKHEGSPDGPPSIIEQMQEQNKSSRVKKESKKPHYFEGYPTFEYQTDINLLKSRKDFDSLETLLKNLTDAESKNPSGPAPYTFQELAMLYRKLKRYQDEVEILEQYTLITFKHGRPGRDFSQRIEKSQQLAQKVSQKK